jgi:hypothetical protein
MHGNYDDIIKRLKDASYGIHRAKKTPPAGPFQSTGDPNPPPVTQPTPDNETYGMGRVPVYEGAEQSTDDLFANLMEGVRNRPSGGGGTVPPPATGPGDPIDLTPPGGGSGPIRRGGGETSRGTETPNLPFSGGRGTEGLQDFINDAGRSGAVVDERMGGTVFQQDSTREILNSQTPLEIDWGNLGQDAKDWISNKWQNWDTGDTVGFLVQLAAGALVPGGGLAVMVGRAALDKLRAAGLDENGNPIDEGNQQGNQRSGSGGGETGREGGSGGGGGYGSGYSGSQTGLGDFGNMNPGSYYHRSSGESGLPGMGSGMGGGGSYYSGYGGFLGSGLLGGGWGKIAPIKSR